MAERDDVDPKHLETAMRHAKVIQKQKDVDRLNFDALEKMLDYPLSQHANVESPAQSDMLQVTEFLQLFRPVDFTELVEERRLADKCGYVLCPRPTVKQPSGSRNKIVRSGKGQPLKVVSKEKLESWCSPECVRRAAYVKYQLKTEPGWLRLNDEKIVFSFPLGEVDVSKPISEIIPVRPTETPKSISLPFRLAPSSRSSNNTTPPVPSIEINGNGNESFHGSNHGDRPILAAEVVERKHVKPLSEPPVANEQTAHNAIEGYVI
jgi:hypothetical protein